MLRESAEIRLQYPDVSRFTVRDASEQTWILPQEVTGRRPHRRHTCNPIQSLKGAELPGVGFAQIETGPTLTVRGWRR